MKRKKWLSALDRTRRSTFGRIATLFGATEIDVPFWDSLEADLLQADLGLPIASSLLHDLQRTVKQHGYTQANALQAVLRELLLSQLTSPTPLTLTDKPWVILLVGVNGSGKTTSTARLAHWWIQQGKSVLLAQADTYRAAASEQLAIWAERLGIEMIQGEPGSDPGAVVYSAIQAAEHRGMDLVLVDTSGRMHTHTNLMHEIGKLVRVAGKVHPGSPHETLLVLDATTGQNGMNQAMAFSQAIPLTGVILAKLDSSARGGIGFAVQSILDLPIQFVGLGENLDDLEPFDPEAFIEGLFSEPAKE
jgi:fused signal recognition particle receptor